ncbi:MAG: hypothetical protein AAGI03_09140 [Pseudomonadota bacterium]
MRPEPPGEVEEYLIARLPGLLALGYQARRTPAEQRGLEAEFLGALNGYPIWALAEACDAYVRQMNRPPTPNDIAIRATKAMAHFTDELARRARIEESDRERTERDAEDRKRRVVDPEVAERMVRDHGFTEERTKLLKRFPTAGSTAEAEAMAATPSAFRTAPTPEELKAARDANPIVQQARAAQARGQK